MTATRKSNIMVISAIVLSVVIVLTMAGTPAGMLIPVQLLTLWPLAIIGGVVYFGYQVITSLRRIEERLDRAETPEFGPISGS